MNPRNWWDGIGAKSRSVFEQVPAWVWVLTLAGIVGAVSAVLAVVAVGQSRAAAKPLVATLEANDE